MFRNYDRIYDIFVNCNWVVTRGSSTVQIYTQTIHRTTQNKQYIEVNIRKVLRPATSTQGILGFLVSTSEC